MKVRPGCAGKDTCFEPPGVHIVFVACRWFIGYADGIPLFKQEKTKAVDGGSCHRLLPGSTLFSFADEDGWSESPQPSSPTISRPISQRLISLVPAPIS